MNDKNAQPDLPAIAPAPPLMARAWNTLSRIDVAENIETAQVKNKDGRLMYTYTYLGWSWAWATLMRHFPESTFEVLPEDYFENGSVMANVEITIREGEESATRKMYLPVMDQKNNSQINPTSRHLNDSRQRCLVKCLALFGLGLDLWTGSEIPVGTVDDPISQAKVDLLQGLYDRLDDNSQAGFMAWLDVESLSDIPESKYQAARKQIERKITNQSKVNV